MVITTATICANASDLSYRSGEQLRDEAKQHGFLAVEEMSVQNHSAVAFLHSIGTIIAFRGTTGIHDWGFNLRLFPTKREWGWLHRGFAQATESLWPLIEAHISEAKSQNRKLIFTGHSLGGAMAVVAALKARYELHHPVSELITFGQPPVVCLCTTANLSNAVIGDYLRFVNCVDGAALAPLYPYFHAGSIRYYDADELLYENMSWIRYFRDAIKLGYRYRVLGQIKEHFMQRYVELLTKGSVYQNG